MVAIYQIRLNLTATDDKSSVIELKPVALDLFTITFGNASQIDHLTLHLTASRGTSG